MSGQPDRQAEVTVRPSRYTVTCVPPDTAPDAHVWALYVEEKRDGSWAVTNDFEWLAADGQWWDMPNADCHHTLDAARALAEKAAPDVVINGRTVTQALALTAAWRAQEAADALARSKEQH